MSRSKRTIRLLLPLGALLALALTVSFVTACGAGGPAPGGNGSGGAGAIEHPTGAKDVVLRVSTGGGFVAPSYNLTLEPGFTLYGDGTVIVTGPTIEIFPQPALPNLQTAKVDEAAVQEVLAGARDVGLFDQVDYGQPGVTDMATTTITVNAGGKTYETAVYALGVDPSAPGLSLEQQQARATMNAFLGKLQTLTDFLGTQTALDWKAYQYTALAVYSVAAVEPGTTDSTDVQPNRLEWPLGDLSTLGEPTNPEGYRKVTVSGADLAKLQPLLGQATKITLWTSGATVYNLYFRPLLPDETV